MSATFISRWTSERSPSKEKKKIEGAGGEKEEKKKTRRQTGLI